MDKWIHLATWPFSTAEADKIEPSSFDNLIGYLYVARLHKEIDKKIDSKDLSAEAEEIKSWKDFADKAIAIDPQNFSFLNTKHRLGLLLRDKEMIDDTARQCLATTKGVADSDYNFFKYQETGDKKYLDLALADFEHPKDGKEKQMKNLRAFFEKYVVLNQDVKKARRNFAITASCMYYTRMSLSNFYENRRDELERVLGKEKASKLLKKVKGLG